MIDPDALKQFQFLLFTKLEGAVTSGMIHLGDRLGLYRALAAPAAARRRPSWPTDRRSRAVGAGVGLQPGGGQAIVGESDDEVERFSLSPEAAAVLADPDHAAFGMGMFHRFPQTMAALDGDRRELPHRLGHDYDSHGAEGAVGDRAQLRAVEPRAPAARRAARARRCRGASLRAGCDRRRHRLRRGRRRAADGRGVPGVVRSSATTSRTTPSIGAEQRRRERGLTNVRFVDPRAEPMPADHRLDLVTTFDCIHDMTHPQG